jgi:hypothetical protein
MPAMTRDDAWLRRLAEAYFDETLPVDIPLDDDDPKYPDEDRRGSVLGQVYMLPTDEPEDCWRFIQIACELRLSEDKLGLLGAGVMEDLMDSHGADFLDRVEAAAKESAAMQTVVDAVWTMSMDPYVPRSFKTLQSHKGTRRR